MAKKEIPGLVKEAVARALAPFGVDVDRLLSDTAKELGAKYMSLKEVEETYGLGRWSVSRLIKSGKIVASKMSRARAGKVLVDVESIERYLALSKVNQPEGC